MAVARTIAIPKALAWPISRRAFLVSSFMKTFPLRSAGHTCPGIVTARGQLLVKLHVPCYHSTWGKSTLFCEKNFVRDQGAESYVLRGETEGHWAWGWTISDCGFSILDTGFWMLVWGSLFGRQRRLPYWILNSGPYFSHHTLMATDYGPWTTDEKPAAICLLSSVLCPLTSDV
jgi:hypothetical protein